MLMVMVWRLDGKRVTLVRRGGGVVRLPLSCSFIIDCRKSIWRLVFSGERFAKPENTWGGLTLFGENRGKPVFIPDGLFTSREQVWWLKQPGPVEVIWVHRCSVVCRFSRRCFVQRSILYIIKTCFDVRHLLVIAVLSSWLFEAAWCEL